MDTAAFKAQLERRKEQLEGQLARFAKQDPRVPGDWDTKYPRIPEGSLEEAADEVEEYSTNLHVEYSLETQLQDVNDALGRMEKGTYGTCDNCSKEIASDRLRVSPEAKLCTNCNK